MASGHRAPRRLAINGFGRIGRLVLRALWGRAGIKIAHINDPSGDAATAAHLLEFDSVHGRWLRAIEAIWSRRVGEAAQPIGWFPARWAMDEL